MDSKTWDLDRISQFRFHYLSFFLNYRFADVQKIRFLNGLAGVGLG